MQNLNLFGVPISEKDEAASTDIDVNMKRQIENLIEAVEQADDGTMMDFRTRKTFVYYDPYNPDESSEFAYLRF